MPLVNLSQIVGKDVFAQTNQNIRTLPSVNGKLLATVKKGDRIGRVYSYVYGKDEKGVRDGSIWLSLYDKDAQRLGAVFPQGAYFRMTADALEWKPIKEQGGKTEEELQKEKEEKDKTFGEKLLAGAGKLAFWGIVVWGVTRTRSQRG